VRKTLWVRLKEHSQLKNKHMERHPLFSKKYSIWWAILAVVSAIRFSILGLPHMKGYDGYGIIFWVIGTLFTALIFGSIPYLIYRLFKGTWDNKIFMICISVMTVLLLIIYK
jgi:hypothetical protein